MKKSLKYRFLLKVVRLLPAKRIMAASKEKAQKLFRKAYKGENIPELTDPDLNIGQDKINGATVLVYQHKKASDRIGIYLVGGGMLKYPQPGQAKEVAQLQGLGTERMAEDAGYSGARTDVDIHCLPDRRTGRCRNRQYIWMKVRVFPCLI